MSLFISAQVRVRIVPKDEIETGKNQRSAGRKAKDLCNKTSKTVKLGQDSTATLDLLYEEMFKDSGATDLEKYQFAREVVLNHHKHKKELERKLESESCFAFIFKS
jgi:hypothetical protein